MRESDRSAVLPSVRPAQNRGVPGLRGLASLTFSACPLTSRRLVSPPSLIRSVFAILTLCLALPLTAMAQGAGTSTVTGTVVDNVGVVPGATVTLTAVATKLVRTNTTNETGIFRFAALPPGYYSLKVETQGFKPVAVDNFIVDAGAIRDLGRLTMTAGNLTEAVTVTAEVTPVQVKRRKTDIRVTHFGLAWVPG